MTVDFVNCRTLFSLFWSTKSLFWSSSRAESAKDRSAVLADLWRRRLAGPGSRRISFSIWHRNIFRASVVTGVCGTWSSGEQPTLTTVCTAVSWWSGSSLCGFWRFLRTLSGLNAQSPAFDQPDLIFLGLIAIPRAQLYRYVKLLTNCVCASTVQILNLFPICCFQRTEYAYIAGLEVMRGLGGRRHRMMLFSKQNFMTSSDSCAPNPSLISIRDL